MSRTRESERVRTRFALAHSIGDVLHEDAAFELQASSALLVHGILRFVFRFAGVDLFAAE